MVADIDGFLPDSAFLLDVPATDWKDAIRLAGKGLVAAGFTTDAYTDQMIETVEKMGPYIVIAPGLALAHSRPSEAVLDLLPPQKGAFSKEDGEAVIGADGLPVASAAF